MNQNTQQQKNLLVAIPAADGGGRNDGVGGRSRSQISFSLIFILFFFSLCVRLILKETVLLNFKSLCF